ncbi:unnamed protein product [Prunus brigantina]
MREVPIFFLRGAQDSHAVAHKQRPSGDAGRRPKHPTGCVEHTRSPSRGTRQLPKGNHPTGYAEHARSPSKGTLALVNLLRETHNQDTSWLHKQFTSQYAN